MTVASFAKLEVLICLLYYCIGNAFGIYQFVIKSREFLFKKYLNFGNEFSFGLLPRDSLEYEWNFGISFYWGYKFWIISYFILSEVTRFWTKRFSFLLIFNLLILVALCEPIGFGIWFSFVSINYLLIRYGRLLYVWIFVIVWSILVFSLLDNLMNYLFPYDHSLPTGEQTLYRLSYLMSSCQLLIISYATSVSDRKHSPSFSQYLFYLSYPPRSIIGPTVAFEAFATKLNTSSSSSSSILDHLNKNLLREFSYIVVVFFCNECLLRMVHFASLSMDENFINSADSWTLHGLGYMLASFFMLKYVVFYGFPRVLAHLDGVELPERPNCVFILYRHAKLWKEFDRGLYSILRDCIYIRIGGSRHGWPRQLGATLLCFTFVFIWHGTSWSMLMWSAANFAIACVDQAMFNFVETKIAFCSISWKRRIKAVVLIPTLLASSFSFMFFLFQGDLGKRMLSRMLMNAWPWSIIMYIIGAYCIIQVGMEIDEYRNAKKNTK